MTYLQLCEDLAVETSDCCHGARRRLSAWLISGGVITETMRREYLRTDITAIEDFTDQWERLTGLSAGAPLFANA